jgi:hypothetical protein
MFSESNFNFSTVQQGSSILSAALQIFNFQYSNNMVYRQWCDCLNFSSETSSKSALTQIPFLPISFFKSHEVVTTEFNPSFIFESSGTTTSINSKHFVKDLQDYKQSFNQAFQLFYGNPNDWCIIGLLPSYLERNNASLVMMVDDLIKQSNHEKSGFYLNDFHSLNNTLEQLEASQQKTLLIGVTFALLDFAEQFPMQLKHTTIMETGGMKGRKKEITRTEVHQILQQAFDVPMIHSEYGMTELLSQAYAKQDGKFVCPPWMKVLVRDEDDPLLVKESGRGCLNIIDLANQYSCSFIATDDVGIVHHDGTFEVHGRLDNSDIRGCSLLVSNGI